MHKAFCLSLFLLSVKFAFTQDTAKTKLKVFIDCRAAAASGAGGSGACDDQYFKTEITIVDFVLNRTAADAHILITSQPVGSGGNQYQLNFYGQNNYKNYIDTLNFTTKPNATPAETRETLLQYMMFGLAPLISKT